MMLTTVGQASNDQEKYMHMNLMYNSVDFPSSAAKLNLIVEKFFLPPRIGSVHGEWGLVYT